MIKIQKKNTKILFKEFLLKLLYQIHNTILFKKLFLNLSPKIYLNQKYKQKQFTRLVLFSTFNLDGKVTKNLEFYLKNLYELGSDIVLIDTSPISIKEEIETIRPYINHYIWRENVGYDFGSWKIGLLETKDWKEYKQIVFTNDSVYGPVRPLTPIFEKFKNTKVDVWGLTDSYEFDYHIMSYFLVFQNRAITSEAFQSFWQNLKFYPTRWKKLLILEYEVGGTKHWLSHNLNVGVFVPYQSLNSNINKKYYMNPTHVYWDTIITDHQFPFLKRDLIKAIKNEGEDENVVSIINQFRYYDPKYIDILN
ncbi:rhamnan synthesis F family protein [Leptospira sp. 96542]|nr:rhamnan synthesis F family protein [Leptospira sp. 96542]